MFKLYINSYYFKKNKIMWRGSQYFCYICSRKRVKKLGKACDLPLCKEKNNNNVNKPRGLHSRPVQWKKIFMNDRLCFFLWPPL